MQEETFNSVNKYAPLRNLVNNIVSNMLINNQEIWKILKYNTNDALSQPDLTNSEKRELIHKGQEDTSDYRVFLQPYPPDDAVDIMQTRLYVSTAQIIPTNSYYGRVDIEFDIISHNKVQVLDTGENRVDVVLQQLLDTLNGRNFGGITNLEFNIKNQRTNGARSTKFDTKFYSGKVFIISCQVSGISTGEN